MKQPYSSYNSYLSNAAFFSLLLMLIGISIVEIFNLEINKFIPFIIMFSMLTCLGTLFLKVGNYAIFLPLFWFSLACFVYYGYGALLLEYGNFRSIWISESYFFVEESLQEFTNYLNFWSISLVLLFTSILDNLQWVNSKKIYVNHDYLKTIGDRFTVLGITFSLIGRFLRYVLGGEYVMPGILNNLTIFMYGGLFIYTYLLFKKQPKMLIRFIPLFLYMLFNAVFSFMKQEIIEFGMVLFFGYFLVKPSINKILVAGLIGLLLFPILTALTFFGRVMTWEDDRTDAITGAVSLIPILLDQEVLRDEIIDAEDSNSANTEDNPVWRRFSNTASQGAAIYYKQNGVEGNSFESLPWILVPRTLFPQKPIVTGGDEFTQMVTGNLDAGGTGSGYFAEGYWNFGLPGVLFVCVSLGFLMVIFSQFSLKIMPILAFQYFPVLFYGIKTGYRVDDWFVASTLASLPVIAVIYLVCFIFSKKLIIKH